MRKSTYQVVCFLAGINAWSLLSLKVDKPLHCRERQRRILRNGMPTCLKTGLQRQGEPEQPQIPENKIPPGNEHRLHRFIVPPGHPYAMVASKNSNMEIFCFEVNAEGNIRYPLAGKRNIVKLFEKEAKELVFKSKVEEVDQVFNNQDEEMFFPGPRQEGDHSYI